VTNLTVVVMIIVRAEADVDVEYGQLEIIDDPLHQ